MSLPRLRELANKADSREVVGLELIRALTADGSFIKRMEAVGKGGVSAEGRLDCLRLLAAAAVFNSQDMWHTIQMLLDMGIESGLLRTDALLTAVVAAGRRGSFVGCTGDVAAELGALLVTVREVIGRMRTKAQEFLVSTIETLRTIAQKPLVRQIMDQELRDLHAMFLVKAEELDESVTVTQERKAEARKSRRQMSIEACLAQTPPEDFRELSVIPTPDDILGPPMPYLRPIREKGPYVDAAEYLDIHFRLLREDYIHELRQGVRNYVPTRRGAPRGSDLRVYQNAQIAAAKVDKDGLMLSTVSFDVGPFKKLQWEASKRLIFGTLLLFSSDDFKTDLVFAVVQNREPEQLRKGLLDVVFENPSLVRRDRRYVMAETSAYFGAYRHVLEGLKRTDLAAVPFAAQIVDAVTQVDVPAYLAGATLDFAPLMGDKAKEGRGAEHFRRPIQQKAQWPRPTDFGQHGLDPSQFEALHHALTRKLAIVQGPPGTGKTYLGLLLLRLLLHPANRSLWWRAQGLVEQRPRRDARRRPEERGAPILIVCYTNHALDQFLEGILDFPDDQAGKVIRVGGRSKVEALEKHGLYQARQDAQLSGDLINRERTSRWEMKDRREALVRCHVGLKLIESEILSVVRLEGMLGRETLDAVKLEREEWVALDALLRQDTFAHEEFFHWLIGTKELAEDFDKAGRVAQLAEWLEEYLGMGEAEACFALPRCNWDPQMAYDELRRYWPGFLGRQGEWEAEQRLTGDKLHALMGDKTGFVQAALSLKQSGFDVSRARRWLKTPLAGPEDPDQPQAEAPAPRDAGLYQAMADDRDLDSGRTDASKDFAKALSEMEGVWMRDFFVSQGRYQEQERRLVGPHAFQSTSKKVLGRQWAGLKAQLLGAPPMPLARMAALSKDQLLRLPLSHRWAFMTGLRDALREALRGALMRAEAAYARTALQHKEVRLLVDTEVMQTASVIGMTTTGAAKYQTALQAIRPPIVVVEEAAEVLEAHLLTSLSQHTQHLVMIGDHQQLRPSVAVFELERNYHLDLSLFERLINNNMPHVQLTQQHRMRPAISRPLMPVFYPALRDHPNTHGRLHIQGMAADLFFLQHEHPESARDDSLEKSSKNREEARLVASLVVYLRQQGYEAQQITVLACYVGQLFELKSLVHGHALTKDVPIKVVDNYQGEESDIIVLSMVRSNSEGRIGFLKTPNRVCVALSRAKLGFYALGNFDFLAKHSKTWTELLSSLKSLGPAEGETEEEGLSQTARLGPAFPVRCVNHGSLDFFRTPNDFKTRAPEGGCREPCNTRMECGHACALSCHAFDRVHEKVRCAKPCPKKCSRSLHGCPRLCSVRPCPPCKALIDHKLPCGHSKEASCGKDSETLSCSEACPKTLGCGHRCSGGCSQDCPPCKVMVTKPLGCGHSLEVSCKDRNEPQESFRCKVKVTRVWPACGHSAELECWDEVWRQPCPKPCGAVLEGCEHVCQGTCSDCSNGRLHIRCTEKCQRVLVCGHACEEQCSEGGGCGPCGRECETACPHSVCGEAGRRPAKGKGKKAKVRKGRRCGEPCPPCAEPCLWTCAHQRCAEEEVDKETGKTRLKPLLCSELCRRPPCDKPCAKQVKCPVTKGCRVKCRGVCEDVEPCIDICPDCQPKEWGEVTAIYFGTEDEEDTIFVRLRDCGHVLPVDAVDQWVKQELERDEVKLPECPKCKTPIRKSIRYGAAIKKRQQDLENIKAKQRGEGKELSSGKARLEKRTEALRREVAEAGHKGRAAASITTAAKGLADGAKDLKAEGLSLAALTRLENAVAALEALRAADVRLSKEPALAAAAAPSPALSLRELRLARQPAAEGPSATPATPRPLLRGLMGGEPVGERESAGHGLRRSLRQQLGRLADWLAKTWSTLTQRQMRQLAAEVERVGLCLSLGVVVLTAEAPDTKLSQAQADKLGSLLAQLQGTDLSGAEAAKAFSSSVKALAGELGVGSLTEAERRMVVSAFPGMGKGHWFKCPNGHYYVIGDCGGAMQTAKCGECNAKIGGGSHRLLSDNAPAPEIDGAIQPAWPLGHP